MAGDDGNSRAIPVEPPVRVECVPTHWTAAWTAGPLSQFLAAAGRVEECSPTTTVLVDDTSVAGRTELSLSGVEPAATVRYLRVAPDAPWTVSWERRTRPVVSVSGDPTVGDCRRLHVETTDCEGWPEAAVEALRRRASG